MPEDGNNINNGNNRDNNRSNGNSFLSKLSPSALTLMANLVVMIVGFGIVWGSQSTRIDDLRDRLNGVTVRLDAHEKALSDDRYQLTNRLVGLETDTKYISQTLQEMKLLLRK
jgi:hypothetical protein